MNNERNINNDSRNSNTGSSKEIPANQQRQVALQDPRPEEGTNETAEQAENEQKYKEALTERD